MNDIKELREKVKDLKLLFVDDEKDIREGTGTFLKKFFNNVSICNDGDEGLELFAKESDFDVIFTDIVMPNMDGVSMAREIRKIDPNVFIVFLTASKALNEIEEDLSNVMFHKPLSFEDMVLIMKKLGDKN